MIGSARPCGYRLNRLYNGKLKMMNLTVLPQPNNFWAAMWGAQYNAARNLQWLTMSRNEGFNSIRILTGGTQADGELNRASGAVGTPWPDAATFRVRATEFAQQCRSLGLLIVPTMSGSSSCPFGYSGNDYDAMIPRILAYTQVWVDVASDIIAYIDGLNEITYDHPDTWNGPTDAGSPNPLMRADMFKYVAALRTVTRDIPLTISTATLNPGMLNSGFDDLVYDLGMDLHDIHLYWGVEPTPAAFAAYEARAKFIGCYVIGETGTAQTRTDDVVAAVHRGPGRIAEQRPKCLGVGMWCISPQDVGGAGDYGYCSDVAATTVRPLKRENTQWPRIA